MSLDDTVRANIADAKLEKYRLDCEARTEELIDEHGSFNLLYRRRRFPVDFEKHLLTEGDSWLTLKSLPWIDSGYGEKPAAFCLPESYWKVLDEVVVAGLRYQLNEAFDSSENTELWKESLFVDDQLLWVARWQWVGRYLLSREVDPNQPSWSRLTCEPRNWIEELVGLLRCGIFRMTTLKARFAAEAALILLRLQAHPKSQIHLMPSELKGVTEKALDHQQRNFVFLLESQIQEFKTLESNDTPLLEAS